MALIAFCTDAVGGVLLQPAWWAPLHVAPLIIDKVLLPELRILRAGGRTECPDLDGR